MNKKNKNFSFEKRAISYDDGFEGKFSQKYYNILLEHIELENGMAILDIGCGTGVLLIKMIEKAEIKGFGIDIEAAMINEAKQKCPEMNIQIAKCEQMPFGNQTFDVLTSCMAYHHFADKKGFAKEAARIIKDDGLLYISDVRFRFLFRKIINGMLKLFRIHGKFCTPQEIYGYFKEFGFELANSYRKGVAQLVILKKVKL